MILLHYSIRLIPVNTVDIIDTRNAIYGEMSICRTEKPDAGLLIPLAGTILQRGLASVSAALPGRTQYDLMNTVQRIAKNTIFLVIGELATTAAGFLFVMYVARYLGAEGFGILSFALAFAAIFGVFADIGLSTLTTREVARDKTLAAKYLGNIAVVKVALGVVVFGAIALTINLLGYPQQTINVVYFIALSVIVNAFILMFQSVFMAYERMEFVAIGRVLEGITRLGGALLVIRLGLGVVDFASVFLMAGLLCLAYSAAVSVRKFAIPKIEIDWLFWKKMLGQAWPFGLTMVFAGVIYWISSVMLSLMQGDEAVGWYSGAYRMVISLIFIFSSYSRAIFPVMSKFYASSPDSMRLVFERSVKFAIMFAGPIGIGTTLLADKLTLSILGPGFFQSIIVLKILIWYASISFISAVFAELFNAVNKQRIVTIIAGGDSILNILLNVVLIPRYGYIGASITAVINECLILVVVLVWSHKIGFGIPVKSLIAILSRVLLASTIMGAFVFLLRNTLGLWWLVSLAALLYFGVLFLVKGISKEDVMLIREAIRR